MQINYHRKSPGKMLQRSIVYQTSNKFNIIIIRKKINWKLL